MIQINKQELTALDLSHWAHLPLSEIAALAKEEKLSNFSTWLLPQLVAWFGTWKIYSSGRETVIKNCTTKQQQAWYKLSQIRRSCLVEPQTKHPDYGQLTPLILLGFRRSQNVSYEYWRNFPELNKLLEPELYTAVVDQPPLDLSHQRLVELQTQGLTIKSGPQRGQVRPADSTYRLSGLQGTEIGHLDQITQMIVCQTWLAHPKNRRETMILDLHNWDRMPQPLVEAWTVPELKFKKTLAVSEEPDIFAV